MIKAIMIIMVAVGVLSFALVVMTATPQDREQYKAYEAYKRRKKHDDHTDCQWK